VTRFQQESSLALYLGMATLDNSSGQRHSSKRPKQVNVRAKAAMMTAVDRHRNSVTESQQYYEKKRHAGKSHNQAIRALGRHLCRIIYKLLKDERPYEIRAEEKDPAGHANGSPSSWHHCLRVGQFQLTEPGKSEGVSLRGKFHNQFNFNWRLAGKFSSTDGDTRVSTSITEQRDEQIRGTIEHLRLIRKPRGRRNMAHHLDDPLHSIEGTGFLSNDTQSIQHGHSRGFHPLLDRQVLSELTGHDELTIA
jgi:hypothetical protein